MLPLARLQEYLHFKAGQHHEVVSLLPFHLFLHETDPSPESNYALVNEPGGEALQDSLTQLQTLFTERHRIPRLQFIEEACTQLVPVLRSSGWREQERSLVMLCTPRTYQPAPHVSGLTIITLSQASSLEEICEGLNANALGFDAQAQPATMQEAEEFRRDLILSRAFTARLNGQMAGAGMFTDIHEGMTELVGIATLEAFRRQGIATALTAFMTQAAFRQGATWVFLIAANEQAGRVYERVGFRPQATFVVYEQPAS
jgi:ribosomal protein S18 acetylase RimI-like enzyme